MRLRTITVTMLLLGCSTFVSATERALDLSLSSDSFRIGYGSFWEKQELHFAVNWLHNDDDVSDGDVVDAGLHALGVVGRGSKEFDFGIGGRVFWVDVADRDGPALGIGVVVGYTIPSAPRLRLAGTLHYAPDVVTFGDLEEYYEGNASVAFHVVERAQIYLGYRVAKAEVEDLPGRAELDDALHVGIRIGF